MISFNLYLERREDVIKPQQTSGEKVGISQWSAIVLETLRAGSLSDERILALLREGDVDSLPSLPDKLNYDELLELARTDWETVRSAVSEGYRIKYNTIYGIRTLLKLKYEAEANLVYEQGEGYLDQIRLTDAQLEEFRSSLSAYWSITDQEPPADGRRLVRIELGKINGNPE
ncbi:hypothetical protein ACFFNY_32075 [Paenibacillus hodogayensis]|uniref:Uncharacterized protein n=1 Tax=Paenibacillus hodogayensis TaxID=279208 RepID=A0ABV5W6P3_9BACL